MSSNLIARSNGSPYSRDDNAEAAGAVPLKGTPVEIAYRGRRYRVGIQDVEALINPFRTPDHVARALLPAPWYELSRRLREAGQRALPLQAQWPPQ